MAKIQKLKFADRYKNGKPVFKPEMVEKPKSAYSPSRGLSVNFFIGFLVSLFMGGLGLLFYRGFKDGGIESGLWDVLLNVFIFVGVYFITAWNFRNLLSKEKTSPTISRD